LELHLRWVGGRGPAVPFVLRLNSSSSVYLRYGVIGGRDSIIDASGKRTSALRDPGGILVEDRRDLPGSRPSWASVPIEAAFSANQEIARTIEVNSQVYLPLRRLSFSPKGEVLLAASGTTGGPVVIKTARPGVCGDLLGFDAVDRLENEFKILSALHNTGKNDFAPAPIGFKAGDPAILILED